MYFQFYLTNMSNCIVSIGTQNLDLSILLKLSNLYTRRGTTISKFSNPSNI